MTPAERQGMWFGLLGVMTFAVTLPMTRLAVGSHEDPHLSGMFLAMGRAAVASVFSLFYLWWIKASWPTREQWKGLAWVAIGVVFGFPLFTSLAMRQVEAAHASVITGVLPLAAVGYAWGSRLSQSLGAEQVICWALLMSTPITLPLAWLSQPTAPVPWTAWGGFAYVCVFSMWLGFFAWYRGLAVVATVFISRRMSVVTPARSQAT